MLSLCSINLSGSTLTDDKFFDYVIEQFQSTGVPTEKICFEVTETVAVANLQKAIGLISRLRKLSCSFALDDFDSGMSSFTYIKNLPVDYVKIDGSFIRDILDDPIAYAMVKSINDIAQVMGKKTVAEFVENSAIRTEVENIGMDYVQGYGVAEPELMDPDWQIPLWLSSSSIPRHLRS